MSYSFICGLDLGQASDFTALAVIERLAGDLFAAMPDTYQIRHLHRWPLGTGYPAIVDDLAKLMAAEPLSGDGTLVVDQTGVGRPVVDLLRRAQIPANLVPVVITGGHAVTHGEGGSQHVPKKELVSALQVLMQTRRIKVARGLPMAAVLVKELENFRVKITVAANETYEAWREGQHDDLVLAAALACWRAERCAPFVAPEWVDAPRTRPTLLDLMSGRSRSPRRGWFGR